MDLKKWLAGLAILALLPLAGCVDVNEDESTADDAATDDDAEVVIDEGTELQCSGQVDEEGDATTGGGECELVDES